MVFSAQPFTDTPSVLLPLFQLQYIIGTQSISDKLTPKRHVKI